MPEKRQFMHPEHIAMVEKVIRQAMPADVHQFYWFNKDTAEIWFKAESKGERSRTIRFSQEVIESADVDWTLLEMQLRTAVGFDFGPGAGIYFERDSTQREGFRIGQGRT